MSNPDVSPQYDYNFTCTPVGTITPGTSITMAPFPATFPGQALNNQFRGNVNVGVSVGVGSYWILQNGATPTYYEGVGMNEYFIKNTIVGTPFTGMRIAIQICGDCVDNQGNNIGNQCLASFCRERDGNNSAQDAIKFVETFETMSTPFILRPLGYLLIKYFVELPNNNSAWEYGFNVNLRSKVLKPSVATNTSSTVSNVNVVGFQTQDNPLWVSNYSPQGVVITPPP